MKRRTLLFTTTVVIGSMVLLLLAGYFWPNNQHAHAALQGDLGAHDPALIKQGNTYYVFSTGGGIQIRSSTDRVNWSYAGTVFNSIPSWISQTVGSTVNDLWAPDISYANGVYYLYYAGSVFGKNTSVIGLATNTTLDPHSSSYRWVDQGLVLHSTTSNNYNAIDPNLTFDAQGNPWLAFGSFWSGLKLRRVDPGTFKLSSSDTTTYSLASNPNGGDAIEAPFLVYRNGYYYLFASIDLCCRGADSTYKTVVGRATSITGPYYNQDGNRMGANGGFTILLQSSGNVRGPGGESVYRDGDTYRLIYHYYDANQNGAVKFNIVDLSWNGDWPQIGGGSSGTTYYKLVNRNSGKVLGISNMSTADGAIALQWSDNGTADHLWQLVDAGGGYYKLVNKNSGKVLGVSSMSTADGAQVLQWSDNGTADHLWQRVDAGGGYYKFVNKNSGKVLDVNGGSTADGASVIQWTDHNGANQQWSLVQG